MSKDEVGVFLAKLECERKLKLAEATKHFVPVEAQARELESAIYEIIDDLLIIHDLKKMFRE